MAIGTPRVLKSEPPTRAPAIPSAMQMINPEPLLLTNQLAIKPEIRPTIIQTRIDISLTLEPFKQSTCNENRFRQSPCRCVGAHSAISWQERILIRCRPTFIWHLFAHPATSGRFTMKLSPLTFCRGRQVSVSLLLLALLAGLFSFGELARPTGPWSQLTLISVTASETLTEQPVNNPEVEIGNVFRSGRSRPQFES